MPKTLNWNPKQLEIIKSTANNIAAFGGYRAGKSYAILFKIVQICRFMPGSKALIGRKHYKGLRADTFEVLFNPEGGLLVGLGTYNKSDQVFTFYNGSIIFFRHFDDENSLKGPTTNIIFLEQAEEIKKSAFDVLKTRNSLWGNEDEEHSEYQKYVKKYKNKTGVIQRPAHYMFVTANPYPCWLKDYFIDSTPENWEIFDMPTTVNEQNLPVGYVDEQKIQMSDQEFNQYIMGSWQFAQGRIYNEFNPDVHIIEPISAETLVKQGAKIICSIDPGYQHYTGVVWVALMPNQDLILYDEIYEREKTTDQIAEIINIKTAQHKARPDIFLIDYAANRTSSTSGKSEADIFKEHRIPVTNADKEVFGGIMRMKSLFKQGKIKVSAICSNFIKELGLYSWDPKRPDHPIKANDDLMDPFRYIVNKAYKGKPQALPDKYAGFTPAQKAVTSWIFTVPPPKDNMEYGL